jgi:O-antigen/teichoic acid export membrane protein
MAGEFLAKLLTFVSFVYLGRILGPEGYGRLEFVLAAMVFFTLPVDFGLGAYGAREVARNRSGAAELLRDVAALRLLLACGSFAVLSLVVALVPEGPEVKLLLLLYGLSLFGAPALLQWFFQGHDQMHWVALASIVRQGVFAGLVLLFLRPGTPLPWIGVCECVSVIVVAAVCLSVTRSRLGYTLPLPWRKPGRLLGHFHKAAPIGLSELAWVFLWYFATLLLALLVGGDELGWFGASHRVVMALHTFVWLYFFNLLPSLSRSTAAPAEHLQGLLHRSLVVTAWAGVFLGLVLTLFGRQLLTLAYGPGFAGAGSPFAVLVWMVPLALLSGHYRYTLIAYNLQKLEFYGTAAAAVVAAGLGLLLIPRYGALGASCVLLAANGVNCALAYAFVQRRVTRVPFHAQLVRPLLATIPALALFVLMDCSCTCLPAGVAVLAYLIVLGLWGRRQILEVLGEWGAAAP